MSGIAGSVPSTGSRIQIASLPYHVSTHGTGCVDGSGATSAGGVVPDRPTVAGHVPGDTPPRTVGVGNWVGKGVGAVLHPAKIMTSRETIV